MILATVLFAAILAINRLFVAEREEGGFDAIRLAPVDPAALFAAKAVALVVYLAVLEALALPAFGVPLPRRLARACCPSPACCCSPTSGSRPWASWSRRSASTRAPAT